MKAAATLLTIATVAMTSQATMLAADGPINFPQIVAQNSSATQWAQSTRFVSACARGFMLGYRKGMYKTNNYRIDDRCFGSETQ